MDKSLYLFLAEAVCAVGLLRTSIDAWKDDPNGRHFDLVGTAFLVSDGVVLTNRHVVLDLHRECERLGLRDDAWKLLFTSFPSFDRVTQVISGIRRLEFVMPEHLDLGLIYFDSSDPAHTGRRPLEAPMNFDTEVGAAVSCLGYPLGIHGLSREADDGASRVYRFGPVLQQGFLSAIAPFADSLVVDRLLLDVRTERGMSGSPIVRTADGALVGVHDAGRDMATSFAVPLSGRFLNQLVGFSRNSASATETGWSRQDEVTVARVRRANSSIEQ